MDAANSDMCLGLENSDSSFVVFYLKARVGAAVVGEHLLPSLGNSWHIV